MRLFEDLLQAWPAIAEPVPDDVASRFLGWHGSMDAGRIGDADPAAETLWNAKSWWHERQVPFRHLRSKPELHFRRAGSVVNLVWDTPDEDGAGPVWSVQRACLTLPLQDVRDAVAAFFRDFLATMARRVAEIGRRGWTRTDCAPASARGAIRSPGGSRASP